MCIEYKNEDAKTFETYIQAHAAKRPDITKVVVDAEPYMFSDIQWRLTGGVLEMCIYMFAGERAEEAIAAAFAQPIVD